MPRFMRFLVHGNLTAAAKEAIVRHGHVVQTLADLELEDSIEPAELIGIAQKKQLDLVTTDKSLAHNPIDTKQKFGRSIVYLQLAGGEVEQDDAIDRLFARYKSPKPGMLYTVTETRVKVRQLPG